MRHAREELGLCLVRAAYRICRAHQVLFAALFFAVKAHRKEHLLRFAIFPTRLHDEARKMPVAVPHRVGKQLLPVREQVARGVGVLLDLDDLGPVIHQVHTINGRAVLAEHLEHLLLKLHGLQVLLE